MEELTLDLFYHRGLFCQIYHLLTCSVPRTVSRHVKTADNLRQSNCCWQPALSLLVSVLQWRQARGFRSEHLWLSSTWLLLSKSQKLFYERSGHVVCLFLCAGWCTDNDVLCLCVLSVTQVVLSPARWTAWQRAITSTQSALLQS